MRILVALALALQFATPELEQEYLRTLPDRPRNAIFTILARYGDGTPARGYIACTGYWCKYDEEEYCDERLPFKTDSRGACIFNPTLDIVSTDEEPAYLTCWATAGTRSGVTTFAIHDGGRYTITIPGIAP